MRPLGTLGAVVGCVVALGASTGGAVGQAPPQPPQPPEAPGTLPGAGAEAQTESEPGAATETEAETEAAAESEAVTEAETAASAESGAEASQRAAVAPEGTGLFAQSLAGAPVDEAAPASRFELGGYVRSDVFVGKALDASEPALQAGYGELALEVRGPRETYGSAYAEARLRAGQQLEDRDVRLDLREAYVDLHAGIFDLRLGQQILVWGRADAFNPTNNLTPLDLRVRSPVEDDRRVGKVGARAWLDFHPVRIEGVWLPIYVPTEYPRVELQPYLVMTDPVFPGVQLDQGLGAGRVHLELAAFEASLSYVNGHAPLPGLALDSYSVGVDPPLGRDPPEVRIARTAYRQHVVGFDFSTAVSDLFALRAEAAYRHPLDHERHVYTARPDLQYVLGVDRGFGPVQVILQYVGRWVRDWRRETGPADPLTPEALLTLMPPLPDFVEEGIETPIEEELARVNQALFAQTERVQHAVTARIEWLAWHETLSLSTLGMLNVSTEEWLVFPRIEYRISDALSTSVGGEIYSGPRGTLFDLVDEKLTAGYAELRYRY